MQNLIIAHEGVNAELVYVVDTLVDGKRNPDARLYHHGPPSTRILVHWVGLPWVERPYLPVRWRDWTVGFADDRTTELAVSVAMLEDQPGFSMVSGE